MQQEAHIQVFNDKKLKCLNKLRIMNTYFKKKIIQTQWFSNMVQSIPLLSSNVVFCSLRIEGVSLKSKYHKDI